MLTFLFVELRVECQSDFGRANMQQLVLVVLCASKLTHYLAQRVVLGWTESWKVIDDEIVNCEDIRKLDVQCWLSSSEKIVELVDLKVCLSVADINQVDPDILQTVDCFGDVAVEWLQVEILTAEQPSRGYLSKNLVDGVEIAAHDIGQTTIDDSPVLRLSKRGLDI